MRPAVKPAVQRATARSRALPLVFSFLLVSGVAAAPPAVSLNAKPVPLADNIAVGDIVQRIRFLGMLVIPNATVGGQRMGQLSDIAWDEATGVLYAVSDKGSLFHLQPTIRDNMLTDVQLLQAVPLRELATDKPLKGKRADAEGMDIVHRADGQTELIISFERYPRIMRYQPDGHPIGEYQLPPPLSNPKNYQDENAMLESVCSDTRYGVLTMPEEPLEREAAGYNRLYSLSGRSWRYPSEDNNNVVSLACLNNNQVLVLERDFGRLWNFRTTLKRITLAPYTEDAPLRPETLVTLDTVKGFQIDNFEGITHHRGKRFFLVSDDNDFFLERTLLLYIELID
ncbi:MAG: esterase-like activity of phytase family protein [Gammaproteobacteria bacterium]|nr:esterase-like activity of phytase family protein [Gammaproteobacteria bacterium]